MGRGKSRRKTALTKRLLEEGYYACPICVRRFGEDLKPTIDHVPPPGLGLDLQGFECLTCGRCNNENKGESRGAAFVQGRGDRVRGQEDRFGASLSFKDDDGKSVPFSSLGIVRAELSPSREGDPPLIFDVGRLGKETDLYVGLLKAAYLAFFFLLGMEEGYKWVNTEAARHLARVISGDEEFDIPVQKRGDDTDSFILIWEGSVVVKLGKHLIPVSVSSREQLDRWEAGGPIEGIRIPFPTRWGGEHSHKITISGCR